jgi:type I restriction enzyme M protein
MPRAAGRLLETPLTKKAIAAELFSLDEDGTRITYRLARIKTYAATHSEELVRAWVIAFLVIERGYSPNCIDLEVPVQMGSETKSADIVLFKDSKLTDAFLVVECVEPAPSMRGRKKKIDQGFSYAINLGAPYVAYASDDQDTGLWEVATQWGVKERGRNSRGEIFSLGMAYAPLTSYSFYKAVDGKNDLRVPSPEELERAVRRAHGLIWAGGKRDPLEAFSEWSKILFAKLFDEWETPTNQPYHLQIAAGESDEEAAKRISDRYTQARKRDSSVFSEDLLLPADKIVAVVEAIQHIDLGHMPLDGLGQAFEQFFGSVFRGDLGQYFTRREIVRFVAAALEVKPSDSVIDPTAGSGGFLLEVLIQVQRTIKTMYPSESDTRQRDIFDKFAKERVFGIEINEKLGRVCQTNVTLHQDGHTNIVVNRSALDVSFGLSHLKFGTFTVAVGNPPFGGRVEDGSTDQLGNNDLSNFVFGRKSSKVASEFLIVEQAWNFLEGGGRFGMVVPDGMLNNAGERSLCPLFRRWLLMNTRLDMIVSLPDFAFRKSGAQNKTSLLFFTKLADSEKMAIAEALNSARAEILAELGEQTPEHELDTEALRRVYAVDSDFDYRFFVAEAEHIGYTPAGGYDPRNDLYGLGAAHEPLAEADTILAEWQRFKRDRDGYVTHLAPTCAAVGVSEVFLAHPSVRLDPKFHVFREERLASAPEGMSEHRLGDLLMLRPGNRVKLASEDPDREFTVLTLQQNGNLKLREPGIGRNPPDWRGQYLALSTSRWFEAHAGDLVFSSIDLWKGCVSVLPPEFEGAIFTSEFPIYIVNESKIDPRYLKLLLRSRYFQRAIRAVTTGHSNRRRTQVEDFENLMIYLPSLEVQQEIGRRVREMEGRLRDSALRMQTVLSHFNHAAIGELATDEFLARISQITDPANELDEKELREAVEEVAFEEDPFAGGGHDGPTGAPRPTG